MKRLCFLLVLISLIGFSYAAIDDAYSFNATTGTYQVITGTQIPSIHMDDALSGEIPIGFTFPYGDFSFTQVKVSSNGWVGLGTAHTSNSLSNTLNSTTIRPVLAPLWDDLSMATGNVQYLSSGTAPNRIFTVQYTDTKWNYSATNAFNFQVRMYENGKIDFIYGSFTGTPSNASASIGINMAPGGTGWFYSVNPNAPASASTTVETSNISTFPVNGTVFEFLPAVLSPNDLSALSITGNVTPSVGSASNYTVSYRNRGTNAQSNYQVQIVSSTGTVLASVAGQAIQPNQVLEVIIPWTPASEGPLAIRGKTVLANDQNPQNDQSPALNVTVMPQGMMFVTVGSGNELANIPVDMYWMNSLFETIYYPNEIGVFGNISALSFYNNFVTNLPNKPTKIWLGTTNQADLADSWIPSTNLTLVYDGNVNYPSGENLITIPLQTMFTYTGGNLVMMVNRPLDTQYFSSMDQFQSQTVGTNRSRKVQADGTTFDPTNPPATATVSGQFPKTTFHLTPLGADPIALINPSSWNFGQVLMNTVHSKAFIVANSGGGTLTVTSVSYSGSPFFTLQNLPTLPAALATGQQVNFNIVYTPTAPGTHTGTITVVDNLTRQTYNIALSATCIDPTIYSLPYAQNFDAITVPNLPIDWVKIQTTTGIGAVRTVTAAPFSAPNCVELANAQDAAAELILIAPPYATNLPVNTSRVNFRAKANGAHPLQVGIMTNSQDAQSFQMIQTIQLTSNWVEYVVSFSTYQGTGRYIAFRHGLEGTYRTLYIDNVMLEVIPQNDLAALSVSGNTTPSVNTQTIYTASVFNWGTNAQSNYQVKLFSGTDVELASVAGTTVNSGQTVQVQVPWTPSTEGPMSLYAKVVLAGDQNPLNDASPAINLSVMPAGMMVITVGDGNEQSRVPVDMYWRNSLFETLIYPQEIGAFGTITALSFYNNFVTNLPNKPTKIWLGSTTQNDLSAGWIPSTQLTLVYDGNINYPSGINTITVPLQTPYPYTGGNLVMMVNRVMDTQYFNSMDNFYAQTIGTNRALRVQSDGTLYDPASPPTGVIPTGQFPKTTLHLTPLGPDPIFMVNPTQRNFGTVLLDTTHNQTFTVMNVGGGTLGINTINIAGSPFYSLQNMPNLPASLNTGQSITFVARYNPTAAGNHAATITINDNQRIGLSRSTTSRTPHTIELTGICVDPTITQLPYIQNFDTDTAPVLPVQWSKIINTNGSGNVVTSTTNPHSAPNSVMMTNTTDANANIFLIAPPLATTIPTNTTRTKFYGRAASNGYAVSVGVMTNPQDAATYVEIQQIPLTTTWTEYVVTFAGYTGTGRSIVFKLVSDGTYRTIYLDSIMFEVTPQNDLAALSVTGNTTPSVGMATTYTVSVFNWGTNPQNTYLVKLYKQGDIEVASVNGLPANPGQTVQVPIAFTPDTQGNTFIYGKVVLTGDQNNLNDQSPNLNISVQPQGLVALTVGTGDQLARIPLDMFYMNSLHQALYFPAELSNTIGIIHGIGFYNDFATNLPNKPTKVWIGTTTQADLSAGWIPSTQLTQVFDGNVNYPSGQNLIHITFSQPFMYLNGQNLVVMVNRPMDTQYFSSNDRFQAQTIGTNRARNIFSDGTAYDPAAPTGGTVSGQFAKTTFFIIPGGVGHLSGTITGAGNQPLAGVAVSFATGGYTATSNAQGQYNIQNIIAGTYQVTFSRYGYLDQTATIVIPEDESVTHNVALVQMAVVTVSGTLVSSDTGSGISGAGISLQGYEDYTASTNTQGQFSIAGVYANNAYAYMIIAPGYQNASGNINVGATNYSMGTITLNEVAYAPRQVQGEIVQNNTQVNLTWLAPDPTALNLSQGFEDAVFPPEDWTRTITNNGAANPSGVFPTWCRFGSVAVGGTPIPPTEGAWQAGLWWSYDHQDEWLITPQFNCPPAAFLRFHTYAFLGSNNGDHYYVKVSTDGGNQWTTLWDASAQTGGWNSYTDAPITLDLSIYEGLQIKLAWHAEDPATNDGLWYVWFIDDVYIGNETTSVLFSFDDLSIRSQRSDLGAQKAKPFVGNESNPSRAMELGLVRGEPRMPDAPHNSQTTTRSLIGYRVFRLTSGNETNENSWVSLTPELHTTLNLIDTAWATLANGNYKWAVKAVYTSNVLSVPSFSNVLVKQVINGTIAGVVRTTTNQPISGATVTTGEYSATTNTVGAYSILLPIGTYSVTASKQGFITQTIQNVNVNAQQTTTINFAMVAGSDNEDYVIPVLATELKGNYPNPFNPSTTISYAIKDATDARLEIYNLKGQLVRTLANAHHKTGHYNLVWNGMDDANKPVSSGIYFYRLTTDKYQKTRKMLLVE